METQRMFINGEWVEAASGKTKEIVNPATGEVFARVTRGGREDARRARSASSRA